MQLERKTKRKRQRLKNSSSRHKDISSTVNLIKVSFFQGPKTGWEGAGRIPNGTRQSWQRNILYGRLSAMAVTQS
jgi:hypothetical protein